MSMVDSLDIRPVVRTAGQSSLGLYVFSAILLAGGVGLYSALSAGREAASAPVTTIPAADGSRISSPPPLALPARFREPVPAGFRTADRVPALMPPVLLQQAPAAQVFPSYAPPPAPSAPAEPASATPAAAGPRTIFEQPRLVQPREQPATASAARENEDRVTAGRLANPGMTIPQGTIIPAVLETAFDSTRPGGARALVQRDIFGFDGTRILIPRGSRLYGTYESGLNLGERRAQIRWMRLMRPDGVIIALDSPASDPLGRAGVEGDVHSRFLTRFGGAILQSVLDLGVGAATRAATNGVIVALPGSTQTVLGSQAQQVQPVLRVDQGTSVSVFVARDLDFSSVDG